MSCCVSTQNEDPNVQRYKGESVEASIQARRITLSPTRQYECGSKYFANTLEVLLSRKLGNVREASFGVKKETYEPGGRNGNANRVLAERVGSKDASFIVRIRVFTHCAPCSKIGTGKLPLVSDD